MVDQIIPVGTQTSVESAITLLKDRFPGTVSDDSRTGYSGVIVDRRRLVDVATYIRDELGFDYLSSATAVD
jgi:hypothetical protein